MFKIDGCFKTFDEGLIDYILGLPGTTAATLWNKGISFFEFLKERAKRVDLAYDDHINESKRQSTCQEISDITAQLIRKTSSLHKKYILEKDMREEPEEFLQLGKIFSY